MKSILYKIHPVNRIFHYNIYNALIFRILKIKMIQAEINKVPPNGVTGPKNDRSVEKNV